MNALRIFFIMTIFLLMLPESSWGVHKGAGDLVCGNCHTMHNSQGRQQLNESATMIDGSLILLRGPVTARSEMHKFCLQCHSNKGAQANVNHQPHGQQAPKVHIVGSNADGTDVWNENKSFDKIGAGGNFYPEIDANFDLNTGYPNGGRGDAVGVGKGHSLGLTNVVPPGNLVPLDYLTCTKCHDHHGTDVTKRAGYFTNDQIHIFRNLKAWGGGDVPGDDFTSWVGGITGRFDLGGNYTPAQTDPPTQVAIWPVYNGIPTNAADSNSYDGRDYNLGEPPSLAGWCAQCHMLWHEVPAPGNISGEDWFRHPVEKVISDSEVSGTGVSTIDWAHYNDDIIIPPGFKLPAADKDKSGHYYANADGADKVFCLSCHFVHGSPYYDNLRWNYLVSISSGSERGNPVPSNKGCQQCHNRGND